MITLVAAIDEAGGIGNMGRLPCWHVPGDLKRFRRKTEGKTVIMGRRTYEEIGRPLPDRVNVVVTSTLIPGVICTKSVDDAIKAVGGGQGCVIGGFRVFEEALPYCTHAAITLVHGTHPADTFFPVASFNRLAWEWVGRWSNPGCTEYLLRRAESTNHAFKIEV